jgi:TRAP-type C4-dicarboxylate transport system permease small subunit
MTSIERIVRFLAVNCSRVALGVLILTGIAINFANVVGRYVFSAPIVWAEEVLAYIMVWCVFIGSVLVMWNGRHIKMDVFVASLKGRARFVVNAASTVGIILVCVFVILQSYPFVSMLLETDQRSIILRLPMGWMNASVLIGFVGMLLVVLVRLGTLVRDDQSSDTEAVVREAIQHYAESPSASAPPRIK